MNKDEKISFIQNVEYYFFRDYNYEFKKNTVRFRSGKNTFIKYLQDVSKKRNFFCADCIRIISYQKRLYLSFFKIDITGNIIKITSINKCDEIWQLKCTLKDLNANKLVEVLDTKRIWNCKENESKKMKTYLFGNRLFEKMAMALSKTESIFIKI